MTVPWADIETCSEGFVLGVSRWRSLDPAQVAQFVQASGNFQFVHSDPERTAREGPFGDAVAHGYLWLSMAPGLLADRITLPGEAIVVNCGLEKLRLAAPVRAGERFRGGFAMTGENRMEATLTILKVRGSIEVESAARTAVVAELLIARVEFRTGPDASVRRSPSGARRE